MIRARIWEDWDGWFYMIEEKKGHVIGEIPYPEYCGGWLSYEEAKFKAKEALKEFQNKIDVLDKWYLHLENIKEWDDNNLKDLQFIEAD